MVGGDQHPGLGAGRPLPDRLLLDAASLLGFGHQIRDDYSAASVPMLPSVVTLAETARRIIFYSVVLVGLTLVFASVAGMGPVYVGSALVLGLLFGAMAVAVRRDPSERTAMRLFSYSITYMTLLFAAMVVDVLVR